MTKRKAKKLLEQVREAESRTASGGTITVVHAGVDESGDQPAASSFEAFVVDLVSRETRRPDDLPGDLRD